MVGAVDDCRETPAVPGVVLFANDGFENGSLRREGEGVAYVQEEDDGCGGEEGEDD